MKISANSARAGYLISHEGELWQISKQPTHVKPGKGPAYVQVEMKNIRTGTKLNIRFSSDDTLDKAELDIRDCQYLYQEDDNLVIMDKETFEQYYISKDVAEEKLPYLTDSMDVRVEFYEQSALNIVIPSSVVLEIQETSPHIKGATVTSSYKPALLSNGVTIMVPPYLETGEKIVVKTEDSTFVERAK
jgi:elongation factor P